MKKEKRHSKFAIKAVRWTVLLSAACLAFILICNSIHKDEHNDITRQKAEMDKQLDSIIKIQFPEAEIEAVGKDETTSIGKESLPSFKAVQELEMSLETLMQIESMDRTVIEKKAKELTEAKTALAKEEENLTKGVTQTIRRVNIIHPDGTHTAFYQRKRSDTNKSDIIGIINY